MTLWASYLQRFGAWVGPRAGSGSATDLGRRLVSSSPPAFDERETLPNGRRPLVGDLMPLPDAVVLTERAAAILQGFPDDWLFQGKTKKSRWSQIGQAMPPPLAEAVARQIAAWLEAHTGYVRRRGAA